MLPGKEFVQYGSYISDRQKDVTGEGERGERKEGREGGGGIFKATQAS